MNPQIVIYAIPFFLITLLIESYFSYKEQRNYIETKDSLTSIALGLGNLFIGLLTKGIVLFVFFYLYDHWRLFEFNSWSVPVLIFAFFADDFTYYWLHRYGHEIRFFWASHMPHHSSPKYNLAAALRQSWTSNITGMFLFYAWEPILGIHPFVIFTFQQISLVYQYWIHTEYIHKMPKWFEYIFNTPSHHRVHHGIDLKYLDKNYGGVLIIWDRIFGTFQAEEEHPQYGLTKQIESYNPAKIAFNEWVNIGKDITQKYHFKHLFKTLFGPPGWSPDGSTLTVEQMRAQIKQKESHGSN